MVGRAAPTSLESAGAPGSAPGGGRVACAYGARVGPDLRPMGAPLIQDLEHAQAHPFYGYSNSAGCFRRGLWTGRPSFPTRRSSDVLEWAWHWLHQGWLVRL